jgi:hypothetical protein
MCQMASAFTWLHTDFLLWLEYHEMTFVLGLPMLPNCRNLQHKQHLRLTTTEYIAVQQT